MKKFLISSVFLAAFAGSAAAADMGFDVDGKPWYFTLQGSYGPVLADNDFFAPNSNAAGPLFGSIDYGNAFVLGTSAGMFLNDNWRVGAEINYFNLDTDAMNFSAASAIGALGVTLGGDADGFTAMIDVGYEHDFSDRFGGFVEAGAGLINLNVNATTGPGFNGFVNSSDTVFAGKVGAGLTYDLTENIEFFGKYNFIFGEDASLQFTAPGAALNPVPFTVETTQHTVLFGFRVKM